MRKITILLVLLFVFSSTLFSKNTNENTTATVTVYYFYWTPRCATCNKIENLTKTSLEKHFSKELKDKSLIYKTINTEQSENNHFEKDYDLYTKSVVISLQKNGKEQKFKLLPKIWEYVHNEKAFYNYIKSEINLFRK